MKLKFYKKEGKKVYTMKETIKDQKTQDAHYKYIKIRSSAEHEED